MISQREPDMGKTFSLVIPAAGTGSRFSASHRKTFILVDDKPLIFHTLDRFKEVKNIAEIVVAVHNEDYSWFTETHEKEIKRYGIKEVIVGGPSRAHTVKRLLGKVDSTCDFIIIHDAVRPFIQKELIEQCMCDAVEHTASITAIPVHDSVKAASTDRFIVQSLARSNLWRAQTPQIFERKLITAAYERFDGELEQFTDDSGLLEKMGIPVFLTMGNKFNIKITTEEDIEILRTLLLST